MRNSRHHEAPRKPLHGAAGASGEIMSAEITGLRVRPPRHSKVEARSLPRANWRHVR